MPKVQIAGWKCLRCGHQWVSRGLTIEPVTCASCKSPYWNKPRRATKKPPARPPAR